MDPAALLLAVALPYIPPPPEVHDLDAPLKASQVALDSPQLNAQILAAMAWPYKYGVTQIPCKAKAMQPRRGWRAAREPSGRIEWIKGPVTKVFWSGIYGTCFIQAPHEREKLREMERVALECECNGWLPER
ncbi:MAG TPA: hypothetical protein VLT89_12565 [Usitatibacter sp.]|nr:hypothetical protein [Usitatibacter sp.]